MTFEMKLLALEYLEIVQEMVRIQSLKDGNGIGENGCFLMAIFQLPKVQCCNIQGVYAQNILEFQGLVEFEKPLYVPIFEGKSNKTPQPTEEQEDGYFQLNPNPAQEYVIINYDLSHLGGNALIQVMDAVGKLMLEENIQGGKDQVVFDISALDAGNYTYRVMHGNTMQYSGKLLVN